jgi:putative transposase
MGSDAQPLPPAAENRKRPHRTVNETAFERLRRKVQSRASADGTSVPKPLQIHVKSDERVLGDSDFVQSVLSAQDEHLEARYRLQSQGYDFGYVLSRVAQLTGLETDQILKPGKQPVRVYARSLLCHWANRGLGMTAVAVSKLLGINRPAVTQAAYRGEAIAAADSLELVER